MALAPEIRSIGPGAGDRAVHPVTVRRPELVRRPVMGPPVMGPNSDERHPTWCRPDHGHLDTEGGPLGLLTRCP
jgi:hypothetical protein